MRQGFDLLLLEKEATKEQERILLTLWWRLHMERLYLHGNNTIV